MMLEITLSWKIAHLFVMDVDAHQRRTLVSLLPKRDLVKAVTVHQSLCPRKRYSVFFPNAAVAHVKIIHLHLRP